MYENTEARVHALPTTLSKVSTTEMATGQALRLRMGINGKAPAQHAQGLTFDPSTPKFKSSLYVKNLFSTELLYFLLLTLSLKTLFSVFYVYECFVCMHICRLHVPTEPTEDRSKHWVPWNCSYRCF